MKGSSDSGTSSAGSQPRTVDPPAARAAASASSAASTSRAPSGAGSRPGSAKPTESVKKTRVPETLIGSATAS